MPDHLWSVLCKHSVTDETGLYVSLIDLVHDIWVPDKAVLERAEEEKIAIQNPMELVTMWGRSDPETPERFLVRVVLGTPKSEQLKSGQDAETDLETEVRARTQMGIPALPLRGAGRYFWIIRTRSLEDGSRWKTVKRVPFQVHAGPPPSGAAH